MKYEERVRYLRFLDALTDSIGDSEEQSSEKIRETLREEGVEIEAIESGLAKFQQEIAMAAKRQALDDAKRKRRTSRPISQKILSSISNLSDERVLERIKELVVKYPDLSISYRELEAKKREDLRTLLEDLERAAAMLKGDEEDGQA